MSTTSDSVNDKVGRIRINKFEDDQERTVYWVNIDMEDGTSYRAKAFANVGRQDKIFYAGNIYLNEEEEQ